MFYYRLEKIKYSIGELEDGAIRNTEAQMEEKKEEKIGKSIKDTWNSEKSNISINEINEEEEKEVEQRKQTKIHRFKNLRKTQIG